MENKEILDSAGLGTLLTEVSNKIKEHTSNDIELGSPNNFATVEAVSKEIEKLNKVEKVLSQSINDLNDKILESNSEEKEKTIALALNDLHDSVTNLTKNITDIENVVAHTANDLNDAIIESESDKVKEIKEVTYKELVNLRNNSNLIPGLKYRITNYNTYTTLSNTKSAMHQFDVIVQADSVDTLNENAHAALHKGDTYFKDSKLEAWELKYCLDNDSNRFKWADTENGKGVIYYMKDEWNNEVPYDFKNIMFKRYCIKGRNYIYIIKSLQTSQGYVKIRKMFPLLYTYSNLTLFMHLYLGYYSEQYLYDNGYIDSWEGLELEDGGTRMFVVINNALESYDIIAEVYSEYDPWLFTFSTLSSYNTSSKDNSLTGKIHNIILNTFANNVFFGRMHYVKILGNFANNTLNTISYSNIHGNIRNTCINNNIMYVNIESNLDNNLFLQFGYNSVHGLLSNIFINGTFSHNNIQGNISYIIADSILHTIISSLCSYLSFPALKNCIVAGKLSGGNSLDNLLEIDFTALNYEQIITTNSNNEIIVKPL